MSKVGSIFGQLVWPPSVPLARKSTCPSEVDRRQMMIHLKGSGEFSGQPVNAKPGALPENTPDPGYART